MYQIAICDDVTIELDKIMKQLAGWQELHPDRRLEIERFTSARELTELLGEERYEPDLLLLDIYMEDGTGISVARELRRMGKKGAVVFITTSREHALEAFGVSALQYLIKPVREQDLYPVLDSLFLEEEDRRRDCVLFPMDGRVCKVPVDEIVYCEAQGKRQCLHLMAEMRLLRLSMLEIFGKLAGRCQFAKVGVSYIVNLDHVDSLNMQEICMDSGEKIFLPRGAYQPLKEQYFRYYCERA